MRISLNIQTNNPAADAQAVRDGEVRGGSWGFEEEEEEEEKCEEVEEPTAERE